MLVRRLKYNHITGTRSIDTLIIIFEAISIDDQGISMAKLITAEERIAKARKLIQKARDLPIPEGGLGRSELSYVAGVKDLLRQARDLVKLIPMRAGVTVEMKSEAQQVLQEANQADQEILRG